MICLHTQLGPVVQVQQGRAASGMAQNLRAARQALRVLHRMERLRVERHSGDITRSQPAGVPAVPQGPSQSALHVGPGDSAAAEEPKLEGPLPSEEQQPAAEAPFDAEGDIAVDIPEV